MNKEFKFEPYYEYKATKVACFDSEHQKNYPERYQQFQNQLEEDGFSNTELWNFDLSIAIFVYPRLKEFRKHINGYPNELTEETWIEILDKMLYAFEAIIDDGVNIDKKKYNFEKVNEGLELFGKYLQCLWD